MRGACSKKTGNAILSQYWGCDVGMAGDGVLKTRNHDIGASAFAIRWAGTLIGPERTGYAGPDGGILDITPRGWLSISGCNWYGIAHPARARFLADCGNWVCPL